MVSADLVPLRLSSTGLRQSLGMSGSAAALRSSSFRMHPYSLERRRWAAAIWLGRDWRAVDVAASQHCPDDPSGLVGHGDGDDPGGPTFEQRADPRRRRQG